MLLVHLKITTIITTMGIKNRPFWTGPLLTEYML